VVKGRDAVLLIDCKNAPFGAVLRREASAAAGAPLTHVVNTHHHADHTGGNHAMAGLALLAYEKAIPRVRAQMNRYISQLKESAGQFKDKGPAGERVAEEATALYRRAAQLTADDFAPRTPVGQSHALDLGGVRAVLTHLGPGHTDNDLVVHLPELNLVHTGDLVFHGRHPFVDRAGGADSASWIAVLRQVATLAGDKATVIPGHGEPGGVEIVRRQIAYLESARGYVAEQIKAGKARKEVAESAPPFAEGLGGSSAVALGAIFDELSGVPVR
jgi:cyclase